MHTRTRPENLRLAGLADLVDIHHHSLCRGRSGQRVQVCLALDRGTQSGPGTGDEKHGEGVRDDRRVDAGSGES